MEGWGLEENDDLKRFFEDMHDTRYEIEMCVRGCYTGCTTYAELGEHLRELAERLEDCANYIGEKEGPFDEEDEEEEEDSNENED